MNQKLQEIGGKLDVTPEDISGMKRAGLKNRVRYWVVSAAITLLSFIIGFFIGKGTCPPAGGGYPFYMGMVPAVLPGKKINKVAVLLLSVIVFIVALNVVPVFGQSVKYGVYLRQ